MQTVYRVEKEDGGGMYYKCDARCTFTMCEEIRHPAPWDDAKLSPYWLGMSPESRSEYRFGYPSLDLLKSWIYKQEWRDELKEYGLRIVVFSCEKVIVGDTQCIWKGERYGQYVVPWSELSEEEEENANP